MTNEERIENLRTFGYTVREASFLTIAALASGYFVRSQYLTFINSGPGGDADFIERLMDRGHAKERQLKGRTKLYHLSSKPLFDALGEVDNRNRRTHTTATEKQRLVTLDYLVMTRTGSVALLTEQEKTDYFHALGALPADLPGKLYTAKSDGVGPTVRYFTDKFPVMPGDGKTTFIYVDEGTHTLDTFERYLTAYTPLWSRLESWEVVYVAPFSNHFERANRIFARRFGSSNIPEEAQQLLQYFRDTDALHKGVPGYFTQEKLIQYRAERERFDGHRYDDLYKQWQAHGDGVMVRLSTPHPSMKCVFRTFQTGQPYLYYGTPTRRKMRAGVMIPPTTAEYTNGV